jgi:ABC-type multidrug transport system fused ATPase/permease subunit
MDHGNIIEHGTHNQLIEEDGVYADLVRKQAINTEEDTSSVGKDTIINETTNIAELEKLETVETRNSYLKRTESVIDVDAYDVKLKKKKEERARIMKQSAPMWKVIKLMRPEWKFLASGVCSAIVSGAIFPCYSYVFARVINLLTVEGDNIPHGPMEGSNLYSFIFFMLALAALIFFSTLRMSFEVAGEKFTKRMRVMVFEAYMRQEVGFYDEDKNSVGALVSKLAVDAKNVNELVTKVWGEVIMILVGLAVGMLS